MSSITYLFLVLCFGASQLDANPTSPYVIELTIVSAILPKPVDSYVKVYGIDCVVPLAMPITAGELHKLAYVFSETRTVNGTRMPDWHYNAWFSNILFDTRSYIALEVWDAQADTFIAGMEMTIAEIETNQADTFYPIVDENGVKIGLLDVAWSYGGSN